MTEKQKDELKDLLREYVEDIKAREGYADDKYDDLLLSVKDILNDLSGWTG